MSALYNGDTQNPDSYPDFRLFFNFEGVEFPVSLKDIAKFEELNKVSINVYGLEQIYKNGRSIYEVIGPLHFCKVRYDMHINLLLLSTRDDENNVKNHYCYISDLSRLVSSQISNHEHKKYFCDGCLQYFRTSDTLQQHEQNDCNFIRNDFPSKQFIVDKFGNNVPENILKFENIHKQMKVPFIVYADFECALKPIQNDIEHVSESYTLKKFEHIPHSFAYYIKCSFDDKISKLHLYRGVDCVKRFIDDLENDIRYLYLTHLKDITPMSKLTDSQIEIYNKSTHCHICKKIFINNFDKVKDHCHITGDFRGAAHAICNLNYKIPQYIPIVMHNLKHYDSHLFIKSLCSEKEGIDVIPVNKEKYISFSKYLWVDKIKYKNGNTRDKYITLRFIDSFQFLPSSLDNLANILDDSQCVEIRKKYPNDLLFKNIRRKGVFPYSYIDDISKFDETDLPTIELFYNELKEEHISKEDYLRAKEMWNLFQCNTLGDYSDTYLKSDVLLLADIFENYRNLSLKTYHLDPAHYFTAPGLSWDAMLLHTGVQLELLTDPDMYHFFKKGVRGGVSTCTGRKSVANNPFLDDFKSSNPTKYIIYLDATNLYGYAMSQYLPQKDFAWLSQEEINGIKVSDISDISDTAETGYVFEVDLEYPEQLHDEHNDLPFCPENMIPPNSKYSKLIPNLRNKKKYVIHYTYLKICLQFGLKLTKIHRALKFTQSPWLKEYIDLNTNLRNSSKNKFDKNLYKTKNNSIYGKTMENVDRRVDVKLVTHWERLARKTNCAEILIAKPYYKDHKIFSENLVAIQMNKTKIEYNKPIYAGFSILDISKTVMYKFFYGYLKKKYGADVSLLYTDTDSLIIEVSTENFYNDIKNNLDKFDTSNYDKDNIYNIPLNISAVGKFKDEYAGDPIKSFYGTGAKAYCVEAMHNTTKKAKGISRSSTQKQLTIRDYINVIEQNSKVYCTMYSFKSHSHTIYTELIRKLALTGDDDKRYLISGTSKTLAWGHNDIKLYELCKLLD
jgi:hypothetical protein